MGANQYSNIEEETAVWLIVFGARPRIWDGIQWHLYNGHRKTDLIRNGWFIQTVYNDYNDLTSLISKNTVS